jgi:hypothetical protein
MAVPTQEKSFRLVTVNKVPERAKQLVGRMIDELKDRYDITHIANCESETLKLAYFSGIVRADLFQA